MMRFYMDVIIFRTNVIVANSTVTARETVKKSLIVSGLSAPADGAMGSYGSNDNCVVRFDTAEKVGAKVTNVNNSFTDFTVTID